MKGYNRQTLTPVSPLHLIPGLQGFQAGCWAADASLYSHMEDMTQEIRTPIKQGLESSWDTLHS